MITYAFYGARHLVYRRGTALPHRLVKILPVGQGLVGGSRKTLRQTRRPTYAEEGRIPL